MNVNGDIIEKWSNTHKIALELRDTLVEKNQLKKQQ